MRRGNMQAPSGSLAPAAPMGSMQGAEIKQFAFQPKTLEVPQFLTAALNKNKKAQTTFADFSYSHKKEYVEWLTEAKRPETREQRLATAIQWLAEGKPRNWKYMNC